MVKQIWFLIGPAWLAGCVTAPSREPLVITAPAAPVVAPLPVAVAVPSEIEGELSVEQKSNERAAAPGPGIFVRVGLDPAVITTARAAALVDALKAILVKKSFVPRATAADAATELSVLSFDEGPRRGLVLEWGIRRPNRRPLRWVRQVFSVREPFDTVWTKFAAKVTEHFANFEAPIHADQILVKASACVPRFGFDADARGLVQTVVNGGPAARAGVRAGDVIEAIDSRPLAADRPDATDDVYERRTPVPIRFTRAGVVTRGTVRPEVLCAGD